MVPFEHLGSTADRGQRCGWAHQGRSFGGEMDLIAQRIREVRRQDRRASYDCIRIRLGVESENDEALYRKGFIKLDEDDFLHFQEVIKKIVALRQALTAEEGYVNDLTSIEVLRLRISHNLNLVQEAVHGDFMGDPPDDLVARGQVAKQENRELGQVFEFLVEKKIVERSGELLD